MNRHRLAAIPIEGDPRETLGVAENAGDEEIRRAYLQKIKENPPDRTPEAFERIRDAYEILRDARRRALHMLLSVDPAAPLVSLLSVEAPERKFTGPGPWLAVLKEK